jgi:hypothetical protein
MVEQFSQEEINKTRQQLGYSQQLETSLQNQQNIAQSLVNQYDALKAGIKQTVNQSNDLTATIEKQFQTLKDVTSQSDKWLALKQKLTKAEEDFNNALDKSKKINNDLSTQGQDVAQQYIDGLTARYKMEGELKNLAEKQANLAQLEFNQLQGIGNISQVQLDRSKADILAQQAKIDGLNEQLEIVKAVNAGNFQNLQNLSEEDKLLLQQLAVQQKIMDVARNIEQNHRGEFEILNKNLGIFGKILATTKNYVDKFKEIEGIKGTLSFFSAQLTTIGISFEGLLKNALAYEATITNAAKQLGISKDGVRALGASYAESASRATEINSNANAALMSTKNQLEAQSQINQSLGTAALFTEKQRIDQVVLTKQMGLTGEEAAKVFKLGLLNQKSAEETAKIIGAQVINLRKATGVNLDFKTVLNDVAKVSGQLAVQYKNNPDLLAKAVTQAKALGLELEQTAGMADRLLNFESSIESELKAELLTGRALNLEQARYLALTGDSAGAAKELMNNVGGLSEFQKLNVIQQRSLAEAIGMSADELSNALVQQELLKGSAWSTQAAFEESVKNAKTEEERAQLLSQIKQASNADELMKQATQISNQEKFNAAIEKLQEMVGKMVDGPLGKMLDKFAAAVSNAETLKNIMTGISVLIAGSMISGIARFVGGLAAAVAPASATAAASMATASAITMGIGIVAVIAGLATAITALNSATGENISVATATGGGITPSEIPTTRTATPQSQPPIVVHSYLQSNGQTIQQWQDTTNMNSSTNKFA